jgi:hypothetical protein
VLYSSVAASKSVFKNIPIQGVHASSPNASCRNFSSLHF